MPHQKTHIIARYAGLFFAVGILFNSTAATAATTPTKPAATTNTESAATNPIRTVETTTDDNQATASESELAEEGGVLGTLGINWKLLIAQLVNFAIVLFVLWKWVFGPVARGLENRTKKIEQSLKDATTITKEKEEFQAWKTKEMSAARGEAATIVTDAKKEAEEAKNQILADARTEQEKLVEQGKTQLESEKAKALSEVKNEIATLVVAATQKILREKLDPAKDKELIKQSLKHI
jgi:F-type H+-transporting ATPase subunit b